MGPYGYAVEYSKDLNENGDYTDDWKLFYEEGGTSYIIAADYLPNKLIPNGTAEENVDKAIYSYNHAIETINNYVSLVDNTKNVKFCKV